MLCLSAVTRAKTSGRTTARGHQPRGHQLRRRGHSLSVYLFMLWWSFLSARLIQPQNEPITTKKSSFSSIKTMDAESSWQQVLWTAAGQNDGSKMRVRTTGSALKRSCSLSHLDEKRTKTQSRSSWTGNLGTCSCNFTETDTDQLWVRPFNQEFNVKTHVVRGRSCQYCTGCCFVRQIAWTRPQIHRFLV